MKLTDLKALATRGESDRLEFKRTTGEIKDAMQTLKVNVLGAQQTAKQVTTQVAPQVTPQVGAVLEAARQVVIRSLSKPTPPASSSPSSAARTSEGGAAEVTAQVTAEVIAQVAAFCQESKPAKAIMTELGLKHWKTFQANYLTPLMAMGILERTIPEKPRSRMQRYRLTSAGEEALRRAANG